MNGFISKLSQINKRSKKSSEFFKGIMAEENMYTLYYSAITVEIIYMLYAVYGFFKFKNTMLNILLFSNLLINLAVLCCAVYIKRKGRYSYRSVQFLCLLFIVLQMGFIIGISVFPLRNDPSVFYPICYILLILIFQFPIWQKVAMFSAFTAVFCLLCAKFKTEYIIPFDMSTACVTYIAGLLFMLLMTKMRYDTYSLQLELKRLSLTDYLTGLQNRRGMDVSFNNAYTACAEKNMPCSMLVIDIDKFKQYNDTFGHSAGDKYLNRIGTVLEQFTKKHNALAARYGGEEFAVLLPECDGQTVLNHALTLLVDLQGKSPEGGTVTVSIGIAADMPQDKSGDAMYGLFKRADDALYRAKNNGRNCVATEDEIFRNSTLAEKCTV